MTEYGFTENEDYSLLSNFGNQTGRGGHNKVDHVIKLDMAKEIAMPLLPKQSVFRCWCITITVILRRYEIH